MALRSFDGFIQHLQTVGFRPKTIIDAGVAWGTPALYSHFPEAYLVLIEALPYFESHLKNIIKDRPGEYHLAAISDEEGSATFSVNESPLALAGASMFHTSRSGQLNFEVEVARLDRLLKLDALEAPILLKTDVQSADLRALKGGTDLLSRAEVVISEANFHGKENLASDMVIFMKSQRFELLEVVGGSFRPYDNALGQIDLVFARPDSRLFAYAGWA